MTTGHDTNFRRLHDRGGGSILVLPNAWDPMSARVIEEAGAPAIATTSAGVSWALGRPDVRGLTRAEMVEAVRRIAAVVDLPVTADIEDGYVQGRAADVDETVRGIISAGAVGINIEDGADGARGTLVTADRQAERIATARAAAESEGVDLFINARIDVFLYQVGDPEGRFDECVRRARVYAEAGADGAFVPGVVDAQTIRRLALAVGLPLNVMAGPGAPDIPTLRELGVTRVSLGPAITVAVVELIGAAAAEMLGPGIYDRIASPLTFPEANGMFRRAG